MVFPTDTVYGVGADATNEEAVARIFAAKARPRNKPLQLLLDDPVKMAQVAARVPDQAWLLAMIFMPGGLTLVLPKTNGAWMAATAGGTTVAVRVPDHGIARELIRRLGRPLAATSANRSGHPSPRTASEASAELADVVDLILDGGRCREGIDSTVVDLTGERPRLLREGAIRREEIAQVLGQDLMLASLEPD